MIAKQVQKHKTGCLLSFIIPLIIRVVPEIFMGPYVVGFDQMAFYIPNTLLWLHNGVNLLDYLKIAPMFYSILIPIVSTGISPVLVLKIIAPLLLGCLGLSIYFYAKKGLNWSTRKSLFVAILGTVYFVALRASWDQLREELGLLFLFGVLTLLSRQKIQTWKQSLILSIGMIAVALSHQLVSVIMFGILASIAVYQVYIRNNRLALYLSIVALPSVVYFFTIYLSSVWESGFLDSTNVGSSISSWTGFASYQSMLVSEGGFSLYCFLPILPLAFISIWRLRISQLLPWLGISLILMLLTLASVSPYRWVLLLTYPLSFYATDSLSILRSTGWKKRKLPLEKAAMLYLMVSTIIMSLGFVLMPPETPFIYFNTEHTNGFPYQIPSSALQNTVSIADCQNVVLAIKWFRDNGNSSAILLTHTVFYGWALLELNESKVESYAFGDPVTAVNAALESGESDLYLIWWTNEQGWYAQPTIPPPFHRVFVVGEIAIYHYNVTQYA